MAITYRTSGGGTAATNSITINKPAGTADGDLLVCCITYTGSTSAATSVPSGWTQQDANTGTSFRSNIYWKIASSEGASWAWVLPAAVSTCAGLIRVYYNTDQNQPYDVTAHSYSTGTGPYDAVNLTTTKDNDYAIFFWGIQENSVTTGGLSVGGAGSPTNTANITSSSTVQISSAHKALTTAGALTGSDYQMSFGNSGNASQVLRFTFSIREPQPANSSGFFFGSNF